jgi:hypothetical protein
MKTIILLSTVVFLFHSDSGYGQGRETEGHYSVHTYLAGAWDGRTRWEFNTIGQGRAPLRPGLGVGLGFEYGPIIRLHGALMSSSIEVAYGQEYSDIGNSSGTIEAGIQRLPIMLWVRIISETDLSPFLCLGAGAARTDFREIASYVGGPNIRFHKWHFSWGIGGGLNYQIDRTIGIELFLDAWMSEGDIIDRSSTGYEDGVYGPLGVSVVGIRGVFSL